MDNFTPPECSTTIHNFNNKDLALTVHKNAIHYYTLLTMDNTGALREETGIGTINCVFRFSPFSGMSCICLLSICGDDLCGLYHLLSGAALMRLSLVLQKADINNHCLGQYIFWLVEHINFFRRCWISEIENILFFFCGTSLLYERSFLVICSTIERYKLMEYRFPD